MEYISDTTKADVGQCIAQPYATDLFAACIGRALDACTDRYGPYLPNPRPCNVNISIALRDAIPKQFVDHPPLVDAFRLYQKANYAICAEASKRSDLPSIASDYCIFDRTLERPALNLNRQCPAMLHILETLSIADASRQRRDAAKALDAIQAINQLHA